MTDRKTMAEYKKEIAKKREEAEQRENERVETERATSEKNHAMTQEANERSR